MYKAEGKYMVFGELKFSKYYSLPNFDFQYEIILSFQVLK